MKTFKVFFTNGDSYVTNANGTAASFEAYLKQDGGRIVDENQVTGEETVRWIDRVEQVTDKKFHVHYNVGKAKYVVSHHDGTKTHKDGSEFFDVRILKNKKAFNEFIKDLKARGYKEE
jgi:hypothetical protein